MNHYSPLEARIRALEKESGQIAKVVGISQLVATDLSGMKPADWEAAGFDEKRAHQLSSGFTTPAGFMFAEKMDISPLHPVIKVLSHEENKWGDDAVVILDPLNARVSDNVD